jgi:hypothetical protein
MSEATMIQRVIESLVAAGPVALILGVLCWKLWEVNQKLMGKIELQHVKMLRLAVRVQRAVEALAGLEAPENEEDLEDSKEDD